MAVRKQKLTELLKQVKEAGEGTMRLTIQQRLQAMERETVVLHDMIKILHKLLKEQGALINEFIVKDVADESGNGRGESESELYKIVCQRRFEKIEQDVMRVLKSAEENGFGLKAG